MEYKVIYTDGSARPNPGRAGWAFYDVLTGHLESGFLTHATNNYAELYAVYRAVLYCPDRCRCFIYTDSRLVIGWMAKGWARNNEQINEIVSMIHDAMISKSIDLRFVKVKGHIGVKANELVDAESRRMTII